MKQEIQKERILAYQLSEKIPDEKIQDISGAGYWTRSISGGVTHDGGIWRGERPRSVDGGIELNWDF